MLGDIGMGAIAELQDDLPVVAAGLRQVGAVVAPALVDDRAVAAARLRQSSRVIAPDLAHIGAGLDIAM